MRPRDVVFAPGARFGHLFRGDGLTARIFRSSMFTVAGFGVTQAVRLVSNLVLTRLLFPEAFGLMALVTVFLVGLLMFSDFGIGPAISRSPRGDDPDFLNTAWTIQILRGCILFVVGLAIAYPVALFYDEPILTGMLMLASVQFLISGFMPTRRDTANRHLAVGHVTVVELISQLLGLAVMVGLAFWLRSVWALVIGSLAAAAIQVALMTLILPGMRNRLRWEPEALQELIHFGKWIFLSTISGFLLAQGDKLILGKYLPLDAFGVYNIGFFLGGFPLMLGTMVVVRVLIPIYRDRPPAESRANFLKLRKMRSAITAGLLAMLAVAAFAGVWLVDLLYDDRYRDAGAIVVLIACIQIPVAIGLTYDQAALAAGESRRFFLFVALKSALVLLGLFVGVQVAGLPGALLGQGAAAVVTYPSLIRLSARLGVWDPQHDLGFALLGTLIAMGAVWWNWSALSALAA